MERIAVVTDSSCSLVSAEVQHPCLRIVEISVLVDNQSLHSEQEVRDAFDRGLNVTTASPSVAGFESIYSELFEDGYSHVFSVHISEKLSSTYQNAKAAAEKFSAKVSVFDSYTAGYSQGLMVLEILGMIDRGASRYEITNRIENYHPYEVLLLPRSVEKLKQGGRIKPSAAVVAQLFQIVPWGKIVDGKLLYAGRARSFDGALEAIHGKELIQNGYRRVTVLQGDEKSISELQDRFPKLSELPVRPIPGVLLAHTGPGAVGFILEP